MINRYVDYRLIIVYFVFRIQRMKKVRHQVMLRTQVTPNAIWKHYELRKDLYFAAFFAFAVHYLDVHFMAWNSCKQFVNPKKALKTQVLKEKTQIIKRKGLSPKKGNDVPPTKIMKKETVSIQRRLGERIQLQTTTNGDNGPRRVIKSKRYRCRRNE